jgi:hypothetical protein
MRSTGSYGPVVPHCAKGTIHVLMVPAWELQLQGPVEPGVEGSGGTQKDRAHVENTGSFKEEVAF